MLVLAFEFLIYFRVCKQLTIAVEVKYLKVAMLCAYYHYFIWAVQTKIKATHRKISRFSQNVNIINLCLMLSDFESVS